jgi:hypothetical protein
MFHSLPNSKFTAACAFGSILILSGCVGIPRSGYEDWSMTDKGCHIPYAVKWFNENASHATWSGVCIDRLIDGEGELKIFSKKMPGRLLISYKGFTRIGRFQSKGVLHVYDKNFDDASAVDYSYVGDFFQVSDAFINSTVNFTGIVYAGNNFSFLGSLINDNWHTGTGKINDYFVDGEFYAVNSINLNGRGIKNAKLYENASFSHACDSLKPRNFSTRIPNPDKFSDYEKCIFINKTSNADIPIFNFNKPSRWFLDLNRFDNEVEYESAMKEYHNKQNEIAQREAERLRLQQIQNQRNAVIDQIRERCTAANNAANNVSRSELSALDIEAGLLGTLAFAAALNPKQYNVSEIKRNLQINQRKMEAAKSRYDQAVSRAKAQATGTCRAVEGEVTAQMAKYRAEDEVERQARVKQSYVEEYRKASAERQKAGKDDPPVVGRSG